MTPSDRHEPVSESLTPLVRQLASQLRASRSGFAVAKSFPERDAGQRPDLKGTLEAIAKAAERSNARQEAVSVLKSRLEEADAKLAAQSATLSDKEGQLRAALDEARLQRARADELERRSIELLEKTQGMLTDAGERLLAAEARAESAESDLTFLKDFVHERLG